MKKVKVYEDNGGGIHAVVFDGDKVANIISGFDDGRTTRTSLLPPRVKAFRTLTVTTRIIIAGTTWAASRRSWRKTTI